MREHRLNILPAMSDGAMPAGTSARIVAGALEQAAAARAAATRPVDAQALARHASRLMAQPAPWLHEEVARRMAERLSILKRPPTHVVDWGAHLGGSASVLTGACAPAKRQAVEVFAWPVGLARPDPLAPAGVVTARAAGSSMHAGGPPAAAPWWSPRRWWPGAAPAEQQPLARPESSLPEGAADLLWSNMVLHHLADPPAAFARWLGLLAVDGVLMFSTLGPGTLETLRRLYAQHGWGTAHAPFVDMHDLGDQLVQAGFADPVMDQEVLTLTWATPAEALRELRQLGGNAGLQRHPGLRTPRWRARLQAALAAASAAAADGRVRLEFEVIYGHAVRPPPRATVAAETSVPLADLRRMLRARAGAAVPRGDRVGDGAEPG